MSDDKKTIECSVTFDEYKAERASGKWGEGASAEDVLMAMFKEKGIRMTGEMKPAPPVEIITDDAAGKFVIRQVQ